MRKLSTITIITLVLLSTPTFAQYPDGSGTEADPWHIADANDLLYLADHPNDYNSHFILTADINLASCDFNTAVIAPDTSTSYSFQGTAFTGTFNGNDHIICNLTIDANGVRSDYLGLFGLTGATSEIKKLGIVDVNITGVDNSNSLGGLVGDNSGNIINCYAVGLVSGGNWSADIGGLVGYHWGDGIIATCYASTIVAGGTDSYSLGGLVGKNGGGEINNCYATGSVACEGSYSYFIGGLIGENHGTIHGCHATGAVSGGSYIGGLLGFNHYGTIRNCYATGTATIKYNSCYILGGLVGENGGTISRCYSSSVVTSVDVSYWIGGLIGSNSGTINNCYASGSITCGDGSYYLGGLVGENLEGNINNCYATGGVVNGDDLVYLGGLVGKIGEGEISNCFWDTHTSGMNDGVGNMDPDPNGAMGRTTTQMQTQSTFTDYGWDFMGETINGVFDYWKTRDSFDYPHLRWQITGDIAGLYGVNFADFAMMANSWRSTPALDNWNSICDLYPNNSIDWLDLQILVENWLKRYNPADIAGSYGVDLTDFAAIANLWRSTRFDDNWNVLCDLYPDYVIDWHDLKILSENWLNGL